MNANHPNANQRRKGLIFFCETNLRYETGFKAWIFLGPYLLGALGLEMMIDSGNGKAIAALGSWLGFIAYLILFPHILRRLLKFMERRKAASLMAMGCLSDCEKSAKTKKPIGFI